MSDLISRKALIEEFEEANNRGNSDLWHITGIKAFIESQPSAQQWIPCSERVPKQNEQIIGTFDNGNGRVIVMQEQFFVQLLESPYPLIAWMPLPEPYKGE
jgi:hypothetical protein